MAGEPEVWLRGPVEGIATPLQPVAHALLAAAEDVERFTAGLDAGRLWSSPGEAAPVGFHLRHMAGSLDRLMTYARGESLSDAQREALANEKAATPRVTREELLGQLRVAVDRALAQLRATPEATLDDYRAVGRAALPSTVRGILHHAAEHTARHAGQVSMTVHALEGKGAT